MTRTLTACMAAACLLSSCQDPSAPSATQASKLAQSSFPSPEVFASQHPAFERYWYQGKAELTRYALRQSRYGDVHDGEGVLIFVTEDFLPKLQVKREVTEAPDAISVLKLNAYRRFYTGIYPYTIMTSSFTPAIGAPTLKLSNTVQEWCGQVYSQVNRRSDGLHALSHSYFEREADQKTLLPDAALEDGLWAQLRIDPGAVLEGKQDLVPALDYVRMRHKALRPYPAVVTRRSAVETDLVDHPVEALDVDYPPLGRKLVIYFESDFPHVIQAWEETEGPFRTTATRTNAILDAYWEHNSADDDRYRDALGLRH
jgi:hypothetical protein